MPRLPRRLKGSCRRSGQGTGQHSGLWFLPWQVPVHVGSGPQGPPDATTVTPPPLGPLTFGLTSLTPFMCDGEEAGS